MFPGENSISLSREAIGDLVQAHLKKMDSTTRVTEVRISYSSCEVSFTTDRDLKAEKALKEVESDLPVVEA
jgi:hypothetical protein